MPEEAEKKNWIEKFKRELNEFTLGDVDLGDVFEPLLEKCAKLAKNFDEFKQCISEGVSTLRQVLARVK